MSFPARDQAEGDDRITPRLGRLYKHCRLVFDFWEPRSFKGEVLALHAKIKREHIGDALDRLVEYGLLIEWPRGEKNTRWFTVTWDRENINGQRAMTQHIPRAEPAVVPETVHKKKTA